MNGFSPPAIDCFSVVVLLTSHDGGSCPRTPQQPRRCRAQLSQLLPEASLQPSIWNFSYRVSPLSLLAELGSLLPSAGSFHLMCLLLIRHLDTKNRNLHGLGLYRLTLADGEHKFRSCRPRGQLFTAHYPPLRCPRKPTFPMKHHPLCTSPILFQSS